MRQNFYANVSMCFILGEAVQDNIRESVKTVESV